MPHDESTTDPQARAREFAERGFVVCKSFFTRDEAAAILADVHRCIAEEKEPAALSDGGMIYTGAVFNRCETTRNFLASQRVIDLIAPIAGPDLWITMDQAVTKNPGAGVFRWHQDNGYNQLKRPHYQLWIALTETRKQNGALTLAQGSHKRGLLPHAFVGQGQMECTVPIGESTIVDADVGDVILFSSLMLHCTGPNKADVPRVAYVAEYMPLADYAWKATPPYFVVARGGKSAPAWVDTQQGARSLKNQLLYAAPRAEHAAKRLLGPVKAALRRG